MEYEESDLSDVSLPRVDYTTFHSKMYQYFTEGKLTDVNIICEDAQEFKCHRLVLAAASEFFENMFGRSWEESRAANIVLSDVDSATFENVLQFAYKGNLLLNDENVCPLLRISDRFGMIILENLCVRYLTERKIPTNHALDLFSFVCATYKGSLIPTISRFILEHLEHFLADEDELLRITFDDMKTLLTHWRPSSSRREHVLLRVLLHWVSHSDSCPLDKKSSWVNFMQTVQFRHIPKDFLGRCFDGNCRVDPCDVPNSDPSIGNNASKTISLHMYVKNPNSYDLFTSKTFEGGVNWYPPREIGEVPGRMRTVVVDNRLYSYSSSMEGSLEFSVYSSVTLSDKQSLATPTNLQGHPYKECNLTNFDTISICSDSINPRIYLCHDLSSRLITNLFTYNCELDKWFPLTKNNDEFKVGTITYYDGRLYAISFEKSAQAYDHRAGRWENLAHTQLSHYYWDKCCCHKGNIYLSSETVRRNLVGGSQVFLEVYDPVADRWSIIAPAPMGQPYSFLGWLKSFENKLWAFGENDEMKRLWTTKTEHNYYIQGYDSFLQKWDTARILFDDTVCSVIDITVFESG